MILSKQVTNMAKGGIFNYFSEKDQENNKDFEV